MKPVTCNILCLTDFFLHAFFILHKDLVELEGLQLAEDEVLSEAEILPLREMLLQRVEEEFDHYLAAEGIERGNLRDAHEQELLNLVVIQNLLADKARYAGEVPLYLPVLRDINALFEDKRDIRLYDLLTAVLKPVTGDLLFECSVPAVGNKAQMLVPRLLARTAVDTVNRLVDSMKTKKSDLRVDTVLSRLKREIDMKMGQV